MNGETVQNQATDAEIRNSIALKARDEELRKDSECVKLMAASIIGPLIYKHRDVVRLADVSGATEDEIVALSLRLARRINAGG